MIPAAGRFSRPAKPLWPISPSFAHLLLHELWSRGVPDNTTVQLLVGWPLALLPLLVFSQIVTPHAVWVVLLVVLIALYLGGYLWVRDRCSPWPLTGVARVLSS